MFVLVTLISFIEFFLKGLLLLKGKLEYLGKLCGAGISKQNVT